MQHTKKKRKIVAKQANQELKKKKKKKRGIKLTLKIPRGTSELARELQDGVATLFYDFARQLIS